MDRVRIISDTVDHGSSFAQMELGLSSPQFIVITSLNEVSDDLPKVIYIDDKYHPLDGVAIKDKLKSKGSIGFDDKSHLYSYLESIYNIFMTTNQLFDAFKNDKSTEQGINQIKVKLESYCMSSKYGFDYVLYRKNGLFGMQAQNDLTKAFLNLYRSYVREVNTNIKSW